MIKSIASIPTMVVAMLIGMNAQAATTWTGAVGDNWSTAGNWSGDIGGSTDPDVLIDGSDTEGVVNVDSTPTIGSLTFTNAVTDFTFSGNDISMNTQLAVDNTELSFTMIGSVSNTLTHTFNNNIVVVDDTVKDRNVINAGDGSLVFNGAVTVSDTDQLEFRGEVTCNNAVTANVLRVNDGLLTLSGSGNALGGLTFVGTTPQLVINTPADVDLIGGKIQHNASATFTLNSANVLSDDTFVYVNGKTVEYRFNADEELTAIQMDKAGSVFNLVLGGASNTVAFLDPGSKAWTTDGSMHITGFRTNSISFGTSSNALTTLQLASITAEGQTGAATLDENGYLSFAGEAPVITGETIVDFGAGSSTNSRPAEIQADTGYTWNFSETEPLFAESTGQNRTIYGGVMTAWSPATNYMPQLELGNDSIVAKVDPSGANVKSWDTQLQGMYVWSKDDFLLGSNGTLSFTNGNAMILSVDSAWGAFPNRFVVKQEGTYYVSDASQSGAGILLIDPSSETINWAPVSTNDYSIGSYGPMSFTDIEAVGIYFSQSRTGNNIYLTFDDFQVRANVEVSPITEISDVSGSIVGGKMIVSWQGTNAASYAVQMSTDLTNPENWTNVVENITGVNDIMSVERDTNVSQAFYRTILEQ